MHLFFFNDPATTEIYTLSLHDALPIWRRACQHVPRRQVGVALGDARLARRGRLCGRILRHAGGARLASRRTAEVKLTIRDRKSTRLNSSHSSISYAVFCLKKKKNLLYN